MLYDVIIFDWDGTLYDSVGLSYTIYKKLLAKYNLKIPSQEDFKTKFCADYHLYYKMNGIKEECFEEADNLWMELYMQEQKNLNLLPEAQKTLDTIRKNGYKIGIVSNGSGERIRDEIKKHNLQKYFEIVISKDEVDEFKPSPQGIITALKHLKSHHEKAIYVGDMAEDILAGRAAGVSTAGVLTGVHTREKLLEVKPTYIFKNVGEVLHLL
ncbi:HAD family hydrolase [Candidatus Micrarchaeota archaeon]|nr:HAD family hydrolase [Candidatus Micrarchaeota archaeon]